MSDIKIPAPSTLKHKGKTLRVQPATARDFVELAEYLRGQHMDEAKKQMHGLPFELAKYAWDQAKSEADKIQPVTIEFEKAANAYGGHVYMLWLSLRKDQPEITLEIAEEILMENFAEISAKAAELTAMEVVDESKKTLPTTA